MNNLTINQITPIFNGAYYYMLLDFPTNKFLKHLINPSYKYVWVHNHWLTTLPDEPWEEFNLPLNNLGLSANILAKNISNGIAQLNYKMESDKSKSTFGSSTTIQSENSSMSMEMPNMNQMMSDLSPEEQQGMALTNQMMPSINMDFDSFFDCNIGMFSVVKGVMTTSINAMGMKINVLSDLEMKRL